MAEVVSELDKLREAAKLIEEMSQGRLQVCPSVVGQVYIRPENEAYEGTNLHLLRSQKFLCKCRMCGARIGPDDNKPCCGGSPSHRKNYLPGGHPIPKILWYLGTGTALRGSAEGGRGQCQTQAGGSRTAA